MTQFSDVIKKRIASYTALYLLALLFAAVMFVSCSHSEPGMQAAQTAQAANETGKRPFYADHPFYFNYETFDPSSVAPPPLEGSLADKRDLDQVEAWQKKHTKAQCAAAKAEKKPDFDHFFGSVSPFKKPTSDTVEEIFWKIRSDIGRTISKVKHHFNRERPYARDPQRFHPCLGKEFGKSYPSGHAAISRMFAQVLAQVDPKHKRKYFAVADKAGLYRVIGGVHHPSDVRIGQQIADEVFRKIKESPEFQADLVTLKTQLR